MDNVVKIKADVMWAFLDKKNEMSNAYQVDLCNLSESAANAIEGMGIEVKEKEGKGMFITCKSQRPIRAFDSEGEEITHVKVGNGSKAVALITPYEWTFKNRTGVSASLKKIVVTDLVEYDNNSLALATADDAL